MERSENGKDFKILFFSFFLSVSVANRSKKALNEEMGGERKREEEELRDVAPESERDVQLSRESQVILNK